MTLFIRGVLQYSNNKGRFFTAAISLSTVLVFLKPVDYFLKPICIKFLVLDAEITKTTILMVILRGNPDMASEPESWLNFRKHHKVSRSKQSNSFS